jgi:transposase
MYDPNELDAKIAKSHINNEKVKKKRQALENKLLENYEFNRNLLPKRNWGQPFDPSKLTMTAKFIIEKHQPHVASYLGFNSGYHSRQEEIAQARKEAEARMTEQTEKLRQQNAEERNLREWRARNNLNVGTGTPNF